MLIIILMTLLIINDIEVILNHYKYDCRDNTLNKKNLINIKIKMTGFNFDVTGLLQKIIKDGYLQTKIILNFILNKIGKIFLIF